MSFNTQYTATMQGSCLPDAGAASKRPCDCDLLKLNPMCKRLPPYRKLPSERHMTLGTI